MKRFIDARVRVRHLYALKHSRKRDYANSRADIMANIPLQMVVECFPEVVHLHKTTPFDLNTPDTGK